MKEERKKKIEEILRESMKITSPEAFEFLKYLKNIYPKSIYAIIHYGSTLWKETRGKGSFFDFFIICKNYLRFYGMRKIHHALLNIPLPPNIYHYRFFTEDGRELRCKVCVVSKRRFKRELSTLASDIYLLGRFGKRVGILFADREAEEIILSCQIRAMNYLTKLAIALLSQKFTLNEFIITVLKISYLAETRIEGNEKIEILFKAEENFYKEIYSEFLEEQIEKKRLKKNGEFFIKEPFYFEELSHLWAKFLIKISRVRTKIRWFKFIPTVEGWVDILLEKLERTRGVKIQLSARERKHPLIFGWKYFFQLKKKKMIR